MLLILYNVHLKTVSYVLWIWCVCQCAGECLTCVCACGCECHRFYGRSTRSFLSSRQWHTVSSCFLSKWICLLFSFCFFCFYSFQNALEMIVLLQYLLWFSFVPLIVVCISFSAKRCDRTKLKRMLTNEWRGNKRERKKTIWIVIIHNLQFLLLYIISKV